MTLPIRLEADAPCPCGKSNKPLASCCFRGDRFLPASVGNLAPLGAFAYKRCYASELKGCSPKLSLEHYVSEAALKVLTGDGEFVVVEGASINRRVPIKLLGAKVLCKNHNEALSPLDMVGSTFFSALHQIGPMFAANAGLATRIVAGVNGHDLERWLLKVLIGLTRGILPETKKKWKPPRWWLQVLYGQVQMPKNSGMSCQMKPGQDLGNDPRIGLLPLWINRQGSRAPAGLIAKLGGLEFTLIMGNDTGRNLATYRPGSFRFTSIETGAQQIVLLGWEAPQQFTTVDIDWSSVPWDDST